MAESTQKKKIIFVDDEPHVLSGLRRMLRSQRNEWDMTFAESGQEALALMANERFDVIVSDMQMPGMSGAELLETINERYPGTVRIVLSGHASPNTMHKVVQHAHQFLAKPYDSTGLIEILQKACLISGLLTSERLRDLIVCFGSLPSVPAIYKELMELIRSDDSSIEAVGQVIGKDPAMSGKVLQVVNSAFYGLPRNISNPEQAVVVLGLETVRDLALGACVFNQIPEHICHEFHLDAMWVHCNRVSRIARRIARHEGFDKKAQDIVTSAGLFHDFGRMIMASSVPDIFRDVDVVRQHDKLPLWQIEKQMLGATHAEIGAYLLGIWGLSDEVICAVGAHHGLHPALSQGIAYAAIINIADFIDHDLNENDDSEGLINHELLAAAGYANKLEEWRNLIGDEFDVSDS